MTHSLGKNTVNFSINLTAEERSIWGRFAQHAGRSTGEIFKELALEGLRARAASVAMVVESIRRDHRQQVAGIVCLLAFLAVLGGGHEFTRHLARRGRRQEMEEVA
jgi:hypothetical protein